MSPFELRPAQPADAEALEQLERRAWSVESAPSRDGDPDADLLIFGRRLPLADVIVACRGAQLLGYVALGSRTRFVSNRHIGVLRALAVAPEARRSGIGAALLRSAEALARERGFRALRLTVLATNQAALALYSAAGWLELGRYPDEFAIEGGFVDDIHLGKRLSG